MSPTPSQFDGVAGDLRSWRRNANWLKASADVVFKLWSDEMIRPFDNPTGPEIVPAEVGFVAMMLAGLALENLAKALVIRREGLGAASSGRLPAYLEKHGIRVYLSRGKFKLSMEDRELVERLERFVMWAGRYPVPKNVQGYGEVHVGDSDIQRFRDLYARLDQALI